MTPRETLINSKIATGAHRKKLILLHPIRGVRIFQPFPRTVIKQSVEKVNQLTDQVKGMALLTD